jgi:hypothetical protein
VKRQFFLSTLGFLLVYDSLAGPPVEVEESGTDNWSYAFSTATYLVRNDREYVNPTFTADRNWLHLEARYNYEALKTGSLWLGYNFSLGEKLTLEATPMVGGVFGDITGFAPGYTLSLTYWKLELFTQGEYFIDAANSEGNFFYTWSELSLAPVDWFRFGIVVDRTKAFGSELDIRRGPLMGVKYKKIDFTTYWLDPGSRNAAFVFALTLNF